MEFSFTPYGSLASSAQQDPGSASDMQVAHLQYPIKLESGRHSETQWCEVAFVACRNSFSIAGKGNPAVVKRRT